ncbi:MAG TPA: hypothetical protein VLV83_25950 [Acidobacteriota bacterium]|nr:hypothetical protein [Acidobacteriota bacterium]
MQLPLLHHEQMTLSLTHLLILGLPFLARGLTRLYLRLRGSRDRSGFRLFRR